MIIGEKFEFINEAKNYEAWYNSKHLILQKMLGEELGNIEDKYEIRKLLIEICTDIDKVTYITKVIFNSDRYKNALQKEKAGVVLYEMSSKYPKRVDLLSSYRNVRDYISNMIGYYNTYLLEYYIDFQIMCTNFEYKECKRLIEILNTIEYVKFISPFFRKKIFEFSEYKFRELMDFTKDIINKDMYNSEKINYITNYVNVLEKISDTNISLYKELAGFGYSGQEVIKFIERYDGIKFSKDIFENNLYELLLIMDKCQLIELNSIYEFLILINTIKINGNVIKENNIISVINYAPNIAAQKVLDII